jgi:hypothetical protein
MHDYLKQRELISREAALEVLSIAKDILDNLAINGDDPQLLARKLTKVIFARAEEEKGLIASVEKLVNYCYYGIAGYLRETCPELTLDEVRMSCFICMGLPNHSLQFLYGFSNSSSLYNLRLKLRKKLGVPDSGITLEQYFNGLTEKLKRKEDEDERFSFE